jgi:hypothetical protein
MMIGGPEPLHCPRGWGVIGEQLDRLCVTPTKGVRGCSGKLQRMLQKQ